MRILSKSINSLNISEILMKIHNYMVEFNKPPENPITPEEIGYKTFKAIIVELFNHLGET